MSKQTRAQRLSANNQFALKGAEEIRAFCGATEAAEDPVFRDYLRFCLVTGQRRTETALMRRRDVNEAWWTIPAEVKKNGVEHEVPLGLLSIALFWRRSRSAASSSGRGEATSRCPDRYRQRVLCGGTEERLPSSKRRAPWRLAEI